MFAYIRAPRYSALSVQRSGHVAPSSVAQAQHIPILRFAASAATDGVGCRKYDSECHRQDDTELDNAPCGMSVTSRDHPAARIELKPLAVSRAYDVQRSRTTTIGRKRTLSAESHIAQEERRTASECRGRMLDCFVWQVFHHQVNSSRRRVWIWQWSDRY